MSGYWSYLRSGFIREQSNSGDLNAIEETTKHKTLTQLKNGSMAVPITASPGYQREAGVVSLSACANSRLKSPTSSLKVLTAADASAFGFGP